jgi:glycosyltransferase involved in cell wall biosynthesis
MTNWILMPVRNGIHLTKKAIETCLSQDIGDVKVLMIDNDSKDGTFDWARTLYPKVVTMRKKPGLSVAQSWNFGLDLAFGITDKVLVVNNDVELRPDTYRRLVEDGGEFVTAVGDSNPECIKGYKPLDGSEEKVKIGKFLKMGIPLSGVVHVGTADGYEIQWYRKLGLKVIGFEANFANANKCKIAYPDSLIYNFGLGSVEGDKVLWITPGDGYGSTFLKPVVEEPFVDKRSTMVMRLDHFPIGEEFDCLVVDVQGMELEVLKGCGEKLKQFKCLNVECSRVPQYEGEASAQEVVDWLKGQGFRAITPICEHDDVLFVQEELVGKRPHPDFSCFLLKKEVWDKVGRFDEGFIGAYAEDADYHVRMHRAGVGVWCLNVPFYHVCSGTVKEMNDPEEITLLQKNADKNRAYFREKYGFDIGGVDYYKEFGHGGPDEKESSE